MPSSLLRAPARRRLLAPLALVLLGLVLPSAASAAWRPFAPDSVWNLALRADAPLRADSAAKVAWLNAKVQAAGAWINTTSCSMPIYWASAATPTVRVDVDPGFYQDPVLIDAWSAVPIPAGAKPSNCSDKNFAVLQRQPDGSVKGWEFWAAAQRTDGTWLAKWGGAMQDVQRDRGVASRLAWIDPTPTDPWRPSSTHGWNVTGSSVSMLAGVVTFEELNEGRIDHALAMATPDTAKSGWLWPAQRTDGASTEADAILAGARLRLDPSLDLTTVAMTPMVRMLAEAAQRYGIVVRDRTWSNTVFYTEELTAGQANPVPALLGGKSPGEALKAFPWSRLQLLDAQACPTTGECVATSKVVIDPSTSAPRVGTPITLDTRNSVLNQPRAMMAWDLNGDGTYETSGGTATSTSFTPTVAGTQTIGLKITMADGRAATGSATVTATAPAASVVLRPSTATATWFYSWNSTQSLLTAVGATTAPPASPDLNRKAYTKASNGVLSMDLADGAPASVASAQLRAYVSCSGLRCLRVQVLGPSGLVAEVRAPVTTSGWVTVDVPGPLSGAATDALRFRAVAYDQTGVVASASAAISAVSLAVTGA